ncbi:MAG: hypothetical protein R6U96_10440 [Promethearchaeia archaeon]
MLIKEKIVNLLENNPQISLKEAKSQIEQVSKSYFYRIKRKWKENKHKQKKNRNRRDYEKLILEYLLENPSGSTITDICNAIDASHNTVSKYLGILEARKRVVGKKVGSYTLYSSTKRRLIPKKLLDNYYLGLLSFFKKEFTDKKKYKDFGKEIAHYLNFPYGSKYPDKVLPNEKDSIEDFLRYLGDSFSFIDFIYEVSPTVESKVKGKKALYCLSNIDLFEKSEKLHNHFYIVAGVLEQTIANSLNRDVNCSIKKISPQDKEVVISVTIS